MANIRRCRSPCGRISGAASENQQCRLSRPGKSPPAGAGKELFGNFGATLSIELTEAVNPFDFLNRSQLVIPAANLGGSRTLGAPVAQTLYVEMEPQKRAAIGITDIVVRLSIGLEDTEDLLADLEQALA